nr:hypothetical protein [Tanacetum cinerariifolium]
YKESLENSSNEIDALSFNQEKEEPPQDSDIRKLIREECCVKVCEEQKQSMEDTMLELVKICQEKELLCIHDNVKDLIESALNTKLLSINSQRLEKEQQEVKNVVEQPAERGNLTPILSTKEPEYSSSMGNEHSNTTPKIESDEIMKSGVGELVPILSENEVTLEDKRECDVPISKNSPICDDHSEIFFDSKNDDDISVYDDFEDIEYVEASLSDPEIVSVEEENVVHQEENVVQQKEEKKKPIYSLLLIIRYHRLLKMLLMTRKETSVLWKNYLSIDSILSHESSDSNFEDNPSVPLPHPEPPNEEFDFEIDFGDEILVVRNTIVEYIDARIEFDEENGDLSCFMFVISAK